VTILVIDRANTLTANDDTFTANRQRRELPLDVLANDLILPGPIPTLTITSHSDPMR